MASRKNVKGQGIICAYCGKVLDYVWVRSGVQSKMDFCCRDHSHYWREENGFYSEMGKINSDARESEVLRRKEAGHFKGMSLAGRAGRQRTISQSNRDKPRRAKNALQSR